jgi:site-specific recombinase XerD
MQTNSRRTSKPSSIAGNRGVGLGDYPHRFKAHLEAQGYRPTTVAEYVRCLGAFGKLMQKRGMALGDLEEVEAANLTAQLDWPAARHRLTEYVVKRFVRFLVEQGVKMPVRTPAPPARARAKLRRDYEAYLRHQRGLGDGTISHCWRFAEGFLDFRFGDEVGPLSTITQGDIVGYLQHRHSRPKPCRLRALSTHLRNFFHYLFQAGKTKTNLALGIPRVAQRYGARLPRHLSPEQVEKVLAAVRSDTPRGRRNYAMVLLLARLGLRAPEVTAMQLEDIDWRSAEMIVRGKGQRHDRVPLPQEVGQALVDYIRLDRVTTSRAVFVTDRAPHGPFKDGQVLNTILRDAFARTGLKRPVPYVGSHILRHSLAVNLVQRGASLEEIADLLRHRWRASTLIYARLDIEGLRSIAQPWPVAGGAR